MKKFLALVCCVAALSASAFPFQMVTANKVDQNLERATPQMLSQGMKVNLQQQVRPAFPTKLNARPLETLDDLEGEPILNVFNFTTDDNNYIIPDPEIFYEGRVIEIVKGENDSTFQVYGLVTTSSNLYVNMVVHEDGTFTIAHGQNVYKSSSYGLCTIECCQVLTENEDLTGVIYSNGILEFDDFWYMVIASGDYAGYYIGSIYGYTTIDYPNAKMDLTRLDGTVTTTDVSVYVDADTVTVVNLADFGMPFTTIYLDRINSSFQMPHQLIYDWSTNEDYVGTYTYGDFYSYEAIIDADVDTLIGFSDTTVYGVAYADSLVFDSWSMYSEEGYVITYKSSKIYFTTEENFGEFGSPTLYVIGEVGENTWAPNVGQAMTYDAETGKFTATVECDGRNDGYNYFSFSKSLASTADDWAAIAADRVGFESNGDFVMLEEYLGQELSIQCPNENPVKIPAGTWEVTVDLNTMKCVINGTWPVDYLRGDVNNDGAVNIEDVTVLIDFLLSGEGDINLNAADCDLNGDINISDVTALIDYLLAGAWAE